MSWQDKAQLVTDIIHAAGGRLIGRTKLQKTVYLLEATGWKGDFVFRYCHYGPYCESLAEAASDAVSLGYLEEKYSRTESGNPYSIYETTSPEKTVTPFSQRQKNLIKTASEANAIELELAATALFLAKEESFENPWDETSRRKPQKASDKMIGQAKALYNTLSQCVPGVFPQI